MMNLLHEIRLNDAFIQKINDAHFKNANVSVDVLRLDKIHPVVSGNKWFKLKYYMQHAIELKYNCIATFGGAYSNHIIATAYACNKQNIKCTGFIRGEKPHHLSETLIDAQALNMQLEFLSRTEYANKRNIVQANPEAFFINEGGYGAIGARGASEILQLVPNLSSYNYIVCACGTGTMLAGIANASLPHQQCVGISIMKNNLSIENETRLLMNNEVQERVKLLHDYHFGGYTKNTQLLIEFIDKILIAHQLPLDFVYTAKAFYAVHHLAEKKYFTQHANVLFIHSGGLQGNRSLNKLK